MGLLSLLLSLEHVDGRLIIKGRVLGAGLGTPRLFLLQTFQAAAAFACGLRFGFAFLGGAIFFFVERLGVKPLLVEFFGRLRGGRRGFGSIEIRVESCGFIPREAIILGPPIAVEPFAVVGLRLFLQLQAFHFCGRFLHDARIRVQVDAQLFVRRLPAAGAAEFLQFFSQDRHISHSSRFGERIFPAHDLCEFLNLLSSISNVARGEIVFTLDASALGFQPFELGGHVQLHLAHFDIDVHRLDHGHLHRLQRPQASELAGVLQHNGEVEIAFGGLDQGDTHHLIARLPGGPRRFNGLAGHVCGPQGGPFRQFQLQIRLGPVIHFQYHHSAVGSAGIEHQIGAGQANAGTGRLDDFSLLHAIAEGCLLVGLRRDVSGGKAPILQPRGELFPLLRVTRDGLHTGSLVHHDLVPTGAFECHVAQNRGPFVDQRQRCRLLIGAQCTVVFDHHAIVAGNRVLQIQRDTYIGLPFHGSDVLFTNPRCGNVSVFQSGWQAEGDATHARLDDLEVQQDRLLDLAECYPYVGQRDARDARSPRAERDAARVRIALIFQRQSRQRPLCFIQPTRHALQQNGSTIGQPGGARLQR